MSMSPQFEGKFFNRYGLGLCPRHLSQSDAFQMPVDASRK